MAGLDENGLTILRQPEVLADIVVSEQTLINPDISTRDDELLGQLNTIISTREAALWELGQAVNDNFSLLKAEGKNLDDLGALTGTFRQDSAKSSTPNQTFVGTNGAVVLAGTVLQNPSTSDKFVVVTDIPIATTSCLSATYTVATVLDNELYTLTVNTTDYTYTSDGTATALEILNGLKADVDADIAATWTATVDTGLEQITITTDSANISVSTITYLTVVQTSVSGAVESQEVGQINAPPNSVSVIETATPSLISTTNPVAYIQGRLRETDEDYRARILIQQQSSGKGTVEAIQDFVGNVAGVTTTKVIENNTFVTDIDGRPPKSFETIVQGGTDADVALAIWISKGAGIETYGNTSTPVTDSSGGQQTINYTRPVTVNLAFLVEYTKYDEETFPVGGETSMADAVQSYTDSLGLDVDVIPSRYFGPIYATTEGIDSLVVKVQVITTPGDAPLPGSWQTTKLDIDASEFAGTTSVDIDVVEV